MNTQTWKNQLVQIKVFNPSETDYKSASVTVPSFSGKIQSFTVPNDFIPEGQTFKICITNESSKEDCNNATRESGSTKTDVNISVPSTTPPSEQSTSSPTIEQPSESPSLTPSQPSQPENNENTQNNNINWESLCNSYGSLVGLKEPCSYYAHGTQLTPAGQQALLCPFGGGVLAVINPTVATAAKELASRSNTICP